MKYYIFHHKAVGEFKFDIGSITFNDQHVAVTENETIYNLYKTNFSNLGFKAYTEEEIEQIKKEKEEQAKRQAELKEQAKSLSPQQKAALNRKLVSLKKQWGESEGEEQKSIQTQIEEIEMQLS